MYSCKKANFVVDVKILIQDFRDLIEGEKSRDAVKMENISLPDLLITAISGFSCRPQDRIASWDGHNGGSPWLKGLIMTNAAVTGSPRVRGEESSRGSRRAYAHSQLRLGLKQIGRVRRSPFVCASHDRCIRHGVQCIVCPSISINSICFRILADNSIGRLDSRHAVESSVRKCRGSSWICPFLGCSSSNLKENHIKIIVENVHEIWNPNNCT